MRMVTHLLCLSVFLLCSCSQTKLTELHQEKKLAAQAFAEVPADFFPRTLTVLSAGDSLTQGIGDSTEQGGYLPYLKTMLEQDKGIEAVDFYNFGVKGNRAIQLLKRLKSTEMKSVLQKADMVILTIGGNDIMKVVKDNISNLQLSVFMEEKESYRNHLTHIIDEIVKTNPMTSIVLVGLYNPFSKWFSDTKEMNEIVARWNEASQTVIAQYPQAYFVSIEDVFMNPPENLLYSDNFHPNDKGYELIAERLNETLEGQVLPDLEEHSVTVSNEEKINEE